jgi:hypothetical protein
MAIWDLNSATASLTGVSTFGALLAVGTDTLTVRSLGDNQRAELVGFGRKGATAGSVRVRSPFLHDPTNGIRARVLAADPSNVFDYALTQPLKGQDPLTFESTGGAAAEQESGWILNYYESLRGVNGRYITAAEADARVEEYVTNEVAVTGGAGATWGSALLSAGTGELKANQEYAVLGYVLDVACTAVGILGPDTAQFRTGGPGLTDRLNTRSFFHRLGQLTGYASIPVINAQNASGTSIQVVDSAGATAVNVDLVLGRLRRGPAHT